MPPWVAPTLGTTDLEQRIRCHLNEAQRGPPKVMNLNLFVEKQTEISFKDQYCKRLLKKTLCWHLSDVANVKNPSVKNVLPVYNVCAK